jgi:ribonuclease VapC
MAKAILDASALLALVHDEPGTRIVEDYLAEAAISAVNLAEVISKLIERGVPDDRAIAIALSFGLEIIPFEAKLAAIVGQLRPLTRSVGLSLGDRACLATGKLLGLPVLTAEAAWEEPGKKLGILIINIRPRKH